MRLLKWNRPTLRARHLCEHLDDPHQLFPVLRGLWNYYHVRAEHQTAHALGEQLLDLGAASPRRCHARGGSRALGSTLFCWVRSAAAHTHFTQGIALYDPQQHRASAFLYGDRCWRDVPHLCRLDAVVSWLS